MRVFVLDAGLEGRYGHHDHFADNVVRELRARNIEFALYGNRQARPELLAAMPVKPLFRHSHYKLLSRDPYDGPLGDALAGARAYAEDLASLREGAPRDGDLVLVPTAGLREVLGLALWMNSTKRRPKVALLFHRLFAPGADLPAGSLAAALYRHAARAVAPLARGGGWLFGATNRQLAQVMSVPLALPVETLPVPLWYEAQAAPVPQSGAPVVAFLGDMRPEKGYLVVPPLIRALHGRGIAARFLVHLGVARNVRDLGAYHSLQKEGFAEIVTGWVPDAQMSAMLARASLVVLPYERARYTTTVSGVFAQAVAHACPCVVPSGTWMAEQVAAGTAAGVSHAEDGVEAIADAACDALGRLDALRQLARDAAPEWRREHSGAALVARLLQWAGST